MDDQIEKQSYSEAQMLDLVRRALQPFLKKWITQAQIVHATGLSVWQVEDALRFWMDRYPSRLDVNKKGELLYWFDWSRTRDPEPPLLQRILAGIGFLLTFLLKLWIVLMVYTYGLIYVTFASLIFAAMSKSPAAVLAPFYALGVSLKALFMGIVQYFKTKGKTEAAYEEKNIVHQVFAFIFGSPAPDDKLVIERRVLGYLRGHNHVLTRADLVLLTGWDWEKADEELTRLISHYRGEPKVSEEGIIYVVFPEIELKKLAADTDETISWDQHYCWKNLLPTEDRYLPAQSGAYGTIAIIFILTLIGSTIHCLFADFDSERLYQFSLLSFFPNKLYFFSFWSSYFPLSFAVLVLLVSAFRQARAAALFHRNALRNQFFTVIKNLYHSLPLIPAKSLTAYEHRLVDRLRVDLRGEPTNLPNGDIAYQFNDFYAEWRTAAAFRGEEKPKSGAVEPVQYAPKSPNIVLWLTVKLLFIGLSVFLACLPLRPETKEVEACSDLAYLNRLAESAKGNPYDTERVYFLPDPTNDACYSKAFQQLAQQPMLYKAVLENSEPEHAWQPTHVRALCENPVLRQLTIIDNPALFPALDQLPTNAIEQWVLDKNSLYRIPSFLRESPNLTQLYLHHNPELKNLGSDWSKATSLAFIELSTEQVADFSPLATAPALTELSISYCNAEGLRQLCAITTLQELTITAADFDALPSDIKNLRNLRYLRIQFQSEQALKPFPKELLKLPELEWIALYNCTTIETLTKQVQKSGTKIELGEQRVGFASEPWKNLKRYNE